jgi:hypothetical protein
MARKKMSDSLSKKKVESKPNTPTAKEDKILKKLEGNSSVLKKLTVEIPENLHTKLKVTSAERGVKIKEIIIELLESL